VPPNDCRGKKPVPVTSFPSGYLASYVTELTGCGGPFSPWLIEASAGQTIQLTLFNFSLSTSSESSSAPTSCSAFAVVTEPAVVTRNVTVCGDGGDITGRQRHVYTSITNRLLLSVWLHRQITEDAPYFMLKYEGNVTTVRFFLVLFFLVVCISLLSVFFFCYQFLVNTKLCVKSSARFLCCFAKMPIKRKIRKYY